ncbi:MAG: ATP-grasp domain-containing protein [Spirochaetota bacterium]|nr:ATP-grasp domain-containing protein [Spirochaetota bacterium]
MKLFEYQAKEVFAASGIPVPDNRQARTAEEASAAAAKIGFPCVLKSQLLQGGRGKAGLIKIVQTKEEAAAVASELFSRPEGVRILLVEEAVEIETELYLSITIDPVEARGMVIACAEGGVEIETLAKEKPGAIMRQRFDLSRGLEPFRARCIVYDMGLTGEIAKQAIKILLALYQVFSNYDAELAEINPLFITKDGNVVAGDAKLAIDDNASFRQKEFQLTREYFSSDAEYEAALDGIPYLQFDGDIGLMCAGAGLTTTVYDLINYEGGSVANYLEFGGPNYRRAVRAMELCLKNPSKVILVVTFGTIARADVMAEGIIEAIEKLRPDRPIVTCIRGTNEDRAVEILEKAGLKPIFDTEEAVREAVSITKGGAA